MTASPSLPQGADAPRAPALRRFSRRRKLLFAAAFALLLYALAELLLSLLWMATVPADYWVYEEPRPALVFDAVRGFRVAPGGVRTARLLRNAWPTSARVVHRGRLPGNSEGWPDRDDFGPRRDEAGVPRWIVCGDSFTAGDLAPNWPDRVEDEARAAGRPVRLLDMSQFGYGLANWHMVLTRYAAERGYDVDGVVFAVWGDDLARRFYAVDHEATTRHLGGRAPGWDPATLPATRAEAARFLAPAEVYLLPPAEFEAALAGGWKPPRAFSWFLTPRVGSLVARLIRGRGDAPPPTAPRAAGSLADPASPRGRLVAEIRAFLDARKLKRLVVQLPSREALLAKRAEDRAGDTGDFAAAIGADVVDGARAFDGLGAAAIGGLFMERDEHWAQAGSDRFADWFADEIARR